MNDGGDSRRLCEASYGITQSAIGWAAGALANDWGICVRDMSADLADPQHWAAFDVLALVHDGGSLMTISA